MNRAKFILAMLSASMSPMLFAQNNDVANALPAIIYLLQSEKAKVVDIALGSGHSCALLESGSIKCWGDNFFGQLGNNSTVDSPLPVKVSNIDNATAIAVGELHTCAIIASGSVKCWGNGSLGQLGYASNSNSPVPVTVIGIDNAVRISLGGRHSCVRLRFSNVSLAGPVRCWGANEHGQLGNGTTTDSTIPIDVQNLTNAITVSLGSGHSCARVGGGIGGGSIQCWGLNGLGQLGNGSTNNALVPVSVSGISNAIDFDSYFNHSCAVLADMAAVCWGSNTSGQFGNGTKDSSSLPVEVVSLRGFGKINVGWSHTCALTQDNSPTIILCWGANNLGMLGDGTVDDSLYGVVVTNIDATDATLASGRSHNCVLLLDNSVKCWGFNTNGQLGSNGGPIFSSAPVTVPGL